MPLAQSVREMFDNAILQAWIDSRERLIEQHDLRLQHQRAGDLDKLALAIGKFGSPTVGDVFDLEEFEQFQSQRDRCAIVPAARDRDQIFQHRHFRKQPADLEGARDAKPANLGRARLSYILSMDQHAALVRAQRAGDDVE